MFLCSGPQDIPLVYCLFYVIFVPLRWIYYRFKKWHYYLLVMSLAASFFFEVFGINKRHLTNYLKQLCMRQDFCYYANTIFLVDLLLYPKNEKLFMVCFSFAEVSFQSSFVTTCVSVSQLDLLHWLLCLVPWLISRDHWHGQLLSGVAALFLVRSISLLVFLYISYLVSVSYAMLDLGNECQMKCQLFVPSSTFIQVSDSMAISLFIWELRSFVFKIGATIKTHGFSQCMPCIRIDYAFKMQMIY